MANHSAPPAEAHPGWRSQRGKLWGAGLHRSTISVIAKRVDEIRKHQEWGLDLISRPR